MSVGQSMVAGFENESNDPRLSTVQRYARAVGGRCVVTINVPVECDWVKPVAKYVSSESGRIDLTDNEVTGFDKAIALYVEHATKTGGRRRRAGAGPKSDYSAKEIRVWARVEGIELPDRGRIPGDIVERYKAAN